MSAQKLCLVLTSILLTYSNNSTSSENVPNLGSNEAYLLLAVHVHDVVPHKIMLKGDGLLSSESMTDIVPGDQYKLISVAPGKYTFSKIYQNKLLKDAYWNIEDQEHTITVKPGVINYGGHLITELGFGDIAHFRMKNRSSLALEYLSNCCGDLLNAYKLDYTGLVSDPYLKFAQEKGSN